ncbi:MAG: WYL domain-containing protein [Candidatus Eisenbacteria bacterium]
MKRSERLHAITEYMRRRRTPVTVADLARYFDVDERTVFRDAAALREQRTCPSWASRAGVGDCSCTATTECRTLACCRSTRRSACGSATGWRRCSARCPRAALAPAVDKVLGSVPREQRDAIRAVIERIVIARPSPPERAAAAQPLDPRLYRVCEQAFIASHALELSYVDRHGAATKRVVEPHGLLVGPPLWYLLAHDRLRQQPRMFRLDRIREAHGLPAERFEPQDPRRLFEEIAAYDLEVRE